MNNFNNQQGNFGNNNMGGFNNQQPQQNFNQQQGFNNQQQNGYGNHQQNGYNNQQQNQYNQQQGYNPQNAGFPDMQIDDNATPSAGFGDLPKGLYPVRITNAEYKQNKSQTGFVLSLEHTVTAGIFAGRKIFDHLNLQNSNEQAQNIAQSNYAKMCQSIGCPRHRNPGLLLDAEYVIDYGPRKKKQKHDNVYGDEPADQEAPEMEVKDRLPLSAAHASGQQQQPQQQAMPMSQPQQQQYNQQPQQQQQQQYNQQQAQQQYNQQQQQPQQQQQFNQQQQQPQNQQQGGGFPGNDFNNGQAQQQQQQPGNLQQAPQQGQNGNGPGNDPVQNSFGANGNPGNMNNGSPFNNGGGQGFGSGNGFGSM